MQRQITFRVREKGFPKLLVVTDFVNVPADWDSMSNDHKREYLVRSIISTDHPSGTTHTLSRFQKATGSEMAIDFEFAETPPQHNRQLAGALGRSSRTGE